MSPLGTGCHVLVAGAERTLGIEFVRQLLGRGCGVVAAHGPGAGGNLEALAGAPGLRLLPLDVRDERSVGEAAARLRGAAGGMPGLTHVVYCESTEPCDYDAWELAATDKDSMLRALEVSAVGPVLLARHFAPFTGPRMAAQGLDDTVLPPVLALLGSGVGGAATDCVGGGYALRAGMAALGAVATALATELRGRLAVRLLHPGYVRSGATRWRGRLGAPEAVAGLLDVIEEADGSHNPEPIDYQGKPRTW